MVSPPLYYGKENYIYACTRKKPTRKTLGKAKEKYLMKIM